MEYPNFCQLHPSVTPEVIEQAAAAGITGVKLYPQGKLPPPFEMDMSLTPYRCDHQL